MKKLVFLLFPLIGLLPAGVAAAEGDWKEGVHYHTIKPEPAVVEGDSVEVVEFFMYVCPHCMQFEPYLYKWLEKGPENVSFTQVPVLFGGASNLHARAYYALELIGERERLHAPFFEAIHKKRQKLKSRQELDAFLQAQGVDLKAFNEAWNSFAVQTKVNRSQALTRRYGIRSVPTVVVDGRFRSGDGFKGYDEKIELIEDLVAKVRRERAEVAQSRARPSTDKFAVKH